MHGKRNWGLDLMRTIAALSVVFSHFFEHLEGHPALKALNVGFGGLYGVELFFVLSGFLIGGILIRKSTAEDWSLNAIRQFWYRRWMRTLPVYYLYLAAYVVIVPAAASSARLWQYITFTQNLLWQTSPGFFGVSWSLTIEEIFYLTMPIFFYLAARLIVNRRRAVAVAIGTYLFSSIGVKVVVMLGNDIAHVDARKFALLRLDAIVYGVFFAYLLVYHKRVFDGIAGFSVLGLLPYVIFRSYTAAVPFFNTEVGAILKFSLAPITLAITLPYFRSITQIPTRLAAVITWTSKLSYSMYLSHILVIVLVNRLLGPGQKSLALIAVYLVLTYAVSWVTYTYCEEPFLRLRDRITERDRLVATIPA